MNLTSLNEALQRAIESAVWAAEDEDVLALKRLQDYLNTPSAKTHLCQYLEKERTTINQNISLVGLDLTELSRLYQEAVPSSKVPILNARFKTITYTGSYEYELNYNSLKPITLFIRKHQGALRAELNEATFTVERSVPEVTRPQSKPGFWHKLWNSL